MWSIEVMNEYNHSTSPGQGNVGRELRSRGNNAPLSPVPADVTRACLASIGFSGLATDEKGRSVCEVTIPATLLSRLFGRDRGYMDVFLGTEVRA
jgi:hypothetical protein